jgi:HEAT repeat protein
MYTVEEPKLKKKECPLRNLEISSKEPYMPMTARSFLFVLLIMVLPLPGRTAETDASRGPKSVTITPHNYDAWKCFEVLEILHGPVVTMIGDRPKLLVPAELRFKEIEGSKLIEAVAATRKLKVHWVREGKRAVLCEGASDDQIDRVRKDLASDDEAVRLKAVWLAGWLRDVRVVPLLVSAARDGNAKMKHHAMIGLRRISWDAVVLLDPKAWPLLKTEMALQKDKTRVTTRKNMIRFSAVRALSFVTGKKARTQAVAILEQLQSDTYHKVRSAAARSLVRIEGEKILSRMAAVMKSENPRVRDFADVALSYIGGEKAKALLQTTGYHAWNVRRSFVSELARVGVKQALPLLKEMLVDRGSSVRGQAVLALGHIGDERALVLLEKVLRDEKHPTVRRLTVKALGHMGGERALSLLEKVLQDKKLRSSAVYALGCIGSNRALVLLEKELNYKDASMRGSAVIALGRIGSEQALTLLEKALGDEKIYIRGSAVRLLASSSGEQTLNLMERALQNKEHIVRAEVVRMLGKIGGQRTLALLQEALNDTNSRVRNAAVGALGNVGDERALALLEKALREGGLGARMHAVGALGRLGGEHALMLIEQALNDKSDAVRSGVVGTLGNRDREQAFPLFEKALKDTSPRVRRSAIYGLRNIGGDQTFDLLEMVASDKDRGVRCDLADTLGMFGDKRALPMLQDLLTDKEPLVRNYAVKAIGKIGGNKARDMLRARLEIEKERKTLELIRYILKRKFPGTPHDSRRNNVKAPVSKTEQPEVF